MVEIKKIMALLLAFLFSVGFAYATQEQLTVEIFEYVDQTVYFNPLKYNTAGAGIWFDQYENQSYYNLTGWIVVTNTNADGLDLADIYVSIDNTGNITLPTLAAGRNGTFISNDTSSGNIILHIPQLRNGENSTWVYSINETNVNPPLNFTSQYSDFKVLAGSNVTVTDTVQNVFSSHPFQIDTCIYDINITQVQVPVDFLGTPFNFEFLPTTTAGADASNVTYAPDNLTQFWSVVGGNCLDLGNSTSINYIMSTPVNIPTTTHYEMINTTIRYAMNSTISHLRIVDILGVSEADLSFEKQIISPSDPILHGSNVTWNVSGYFETQTNITYLINEVTFWVSQRNVNGSYTDPNTIDNDTISGSQLQVVSNPFVTFNTSNPWSSNSWLFNYSDIPSPIVWMDVNFTINNDGVQLINRSITRNDNDVYIKELYLIIGYWLEINKNVTSIGDNEYNIKIDVHNKGNQVTPAGSIVTIYDFIPSNYNVTGAFVYSTSPWYNTAEASNNITGFYNGTLWQWALTPTNVLNTSFAQGPAFNENTTWSVEYNVTGFGDYTLMDVFVTGLDPQKVDGAGASKAVVVSEVIDRLKSTEGIFAAIAGVLLLLGLLL